MKNSVVGAPCGVMDHMTSARGEANKLLAMVCQVHEFNDCSCKLSNGSNGFVLKQVILVLGQMVWANLEHFSPRENRPKHSKVLFSMISLMIFQ